MKLPTCSLLLAAGLTFAGCDTVTSGMGSMDGTSAGGAIEMLANQPAVYTFSIPKNAEVGQYWEVEQSGMTTRTAIVAEEDGKFIVEQSGGSYGDNVVQAFLVDPSVGHGGNARAG